MPSEDVRRTMPLMDTVSNNTLDRRVARTDAALQDALVRLTEDRGFDGFGVADLCATAEVTRATFYNHYADKEALLDSMEQAILADLRVIQEGMADLSLPAILKSQAAHRPLPVLVELFDYLRVQSAFLHAVMGPGGDIRFAPRLRDSVCSELIQSVLHEKYRRDPSPFVNYYVAFFASAYLGIITRWMDTGMRESSQEMALIAMRLFFIKPGESIKL